MDEIFAAHFARYPLMEPRDAVKLAYQSTCGGGHLIGRGDALTRLREEFASVSPREIPLIEEIGGGHSRLYLSCDQCRPEWLESIAFLFAQGAKAPACGPEALDRPLAILRALTAAGAAPFSTEALETYLRDYDAAGRPMVSHTEAYRAAYAPAYRVMEADLLRLLPVFTALDELLLRRDRVVVAIDGMAAAGKTTLAALLEQRYGCPVIHVDDFFLPPELRTPERFAEPGGNVHYERFREQVLTGLASGAVFSYDVFDCHSMACTRKSIVKPDRLTVIEGSYALHPALRDSYGLKVFCPVEAGEQLRRIRARSGEAALAVFRDRWIPLENAYIAACGVRECADLIL